MKACVRVNVYRIAVDRPFKPGAGDGDDFIVAEPLANFGAATCFDEGLRVVGNATYCLEKVKSKASQKPKRVHVMGPHPLE